MDIVDATTTSKATPLDPSIACATDYSTVNPNIMVSDATLVMLITDGLFLSPSKDMPVYVRDVHEVFIRHFRNTLSPLFHRRL